LSGFAPKTHGSLEFKQAVRLLRNVRTFRNKSAGTSKEVLANWVSATLEKALTEKNVKSGFHTTGISPFNPHAMDGKMGPSEFYRGGPSTVEEEMVVGALGDLGASKNIWKINRESFQEGIQCSAEGSPTRHTPLAEGQEVGSYNNESLSKSKEQEEYFASLEAALAEGEEQPVKGPPRRYYFRMMMAGRRN
jgi:hypothetical protein